jgi:diacylglycerol kinase (ATP)
MRRVALIYNPASGQYSARRKAAIEQVLTVLRQAGAEAEAFVTETPGSATAHAEEAVRAGYDAILACGGDGTVHEVLQSLVGTDVALGVVPLGTANALAANLGLIGSPAKAAQRLLEAERVRIPVGRVHFQNGGAVPDSRYFLVAAGVGADALLMARLDPVLKRRFGYVLYMVEAFKIWATDSFPYFEAAFPANGNGGARVAQVSQLLAVRVRSFGGALRRLAPGATLLKPDLRLLAFGTRSRFRYMRFLLAVLAGRHTFGREIELVETEAVECRTANPNDVLYVEADGEVLGHLPARMETVPDALTLLVPEGAEP